MAKENRRPLDRTRPHLGLLYPAGRDRNLILRGSNGLGKTILTRNVAHAAALATLSVLFRTAPDLLADLDGDSPGLRRRFRFCVRPALLALDECSYLSYDAHAANLLFESSAGAKQRQDEVRLPGVRDLAASAVQTRPVDSRFRGNDDGGDGRLESRHSRESGNPPLASCWCLNHGSRMHAKRLGMSFRGRGEAPETL
jgi:hypothetical protein